MCANIGVYKDIPQVDMLVNLSHVSELRNVQVNTIHFFVKSYPKINDCSL